MATDFQQIEWDSAIEDDCRQIVRLAVREDLDRTYDWTTVALVPSGAAGRAHVAARRGGMLAGLPAAELALNEMAPDATWQTYAHDGDRLQPGQRIATMAGPARSLLTAERVVLNLLGCLSGIASLTRKYVDLVAGTRAHIYDTRKTTPGWRRLEKYAVRCGGGRNHRLGLYDAILIKDNHLALGAEIAGHDRFTPAQAVERARQFLRNLQLEGQQAPTIVEVEVDTLVQLEQVLPARPDIVLLDNMTNAQLADAVALRDRIAPQIQLEASGGVNLDTVAAIALTGVERISVGALTHSAVSLDVGLDWE